MALGDKGKCEICSREGKVVISEVMEKQPSLGINEDWLFEYALCRWHRAAQTRENNKMKK